MSKRIISIAVMVMMLLTIVPALPGGEAAAATYKIKTLTATAKSTSKVALKWSKTTVKSSQYTGYAVYRGGKMIKRVGKKTTSYTDSGLKANTSYKYVIKTYKVKKVTKWYNKKTKKWQTKKPKKKYRGKSKTVKKYTYANPSPSKTVKTKSKPATGGDKPIMSIDDENGTIYAIDADKPYTMPKSGKITDFKGVTRTISYDSKYDYYLVGDACVKLSGLPRYDKNCNGIFKDGSTVYTQINGTTITVGKPMGLNSSPSVEAKMYNGDASKLEIRVANICNVNTYDYYKNPIVATFVMKDKKRLIEYYGTTDTERNSIVTKKACFSNQEELFAGVGFVKGTVKLDVYYDGHKAATRSFETNSNANSEGLGPTRAALLAFAENAIAENGGKKSYSDDMSAIKWYIAGCYKGTKVGGLDLSCIGGAAILETYSIYHYGKYGFASYGSQREGMPNYGSHVAFHLNEDPSWYYESNGTWNQ